MVAQSIRTLSANPSGWTESRKELPGLFLVGAESFQTELAACKGGGGARLLRVRFWLGTNGSWGPSATSTRSSADGNVGPKNRPAFCWSCITANRSQLYNLEYRGKDQHDRKIPQLQHSGFSAVMTARNGSQRNPPSTLKQQTHLGGDGWHWDDRTLHTTPDSTCT